MSVMDERERFSRHYPIDPATLWVALRRALATMDLREADDASHTARFGSGVTLTSWGQHLIAEVTAAAEGGATLTVRGRPKGSFLSSNWGERVHAETIERQVTRALDAVMGQQPRSG